MSNLNKSLLRRPDSSERHHIFNKNQAMKHLIYATALVGVLGMALVSSPAAVAKTGNGVSSRLNALEAKDKIGKTILAFVAALNSPFISGSMDPFGPILDAFDEEVVLTATPPPGMGMAMTFAGKDDVTGTEPLQYGRVVVVTKPNILASAMNITLENEATTAVVDLRFANSANFPPGCTPGSTGCAQVMLFADVYVTLELAQNVWQVTNVNLKHYIAHSIPMM